MDCIFCSIAAGRVPAEIVYSGNRVLAFLDVNPIHPGHVLIIPKRHSRDLTELPEEVLGELMLATQTVAAGLVHSLDLQGFNLFSNNGAIAGQSVFHFHLHVTPRYPQDNIRFVHGTKEYGPGEMAAVGERIRQAIRDNVSSKEQ
ncbi:MAG: HIT family protein [Ignavibacteria bacterium]|nr:HIT family protein [Ignavibacteria bacterium]